MPEACPTLPDALADEGVGLAVIPLIVQSQPVGLSGRTTIAHPDLAHIRSRRSQGLPATPIVFVLLLSSAALPVASLSTVFVMCWVDWRVSSATDELALRALALTGVAGSGAIRPDRSRPISRTFIAR